MATKIKSHSVAKDHLYYSSPSGCVYLKLSENDYLCIASVEVIPGWHWTEKENIDTLRPFYGTIEITP